MRRSGVRIPLPPPISLQRNSKRFPGDEERSSTGGARQRRVLIPLSRDHSPEAPQNSSIFRVDSIERVGRMKRRTFLRTGLASTALSLSPALVASREEKDKAASPPTETPVKPFVFEETTIADLQVAM